ncbi:hypothetical protein [Streptomyces sp. NPDC050988]|uniref:hypothetical protein n=1 Tax=Streptomyces sp. NPDC050988 TaxID=3365637 RepID=UPI0037BD6808
MRIRRVVACLAAVALGAGIPATAASAASESMEGGTAAAHVADWWGKSSYYSTEPVCSDRKEAMARQNFTVRPSKPGCYKNGVGWYFEFLI